MAYLRQSLWTVFVLIAAALAHGGHEAVPEGESISQDPIVRGTTTIFPSQKVNRLIPGLNIMDSYDSDGFGFWHNLPYGNGSRGMYYFTYLSVSNLPSHPFLTKEIR